MKYKLEKLIDVNNAKGFGELQKGSNGIIHDSE